MTDAKVLEKSLFAEGIDIPQKILENAGGMDGKDNENISLASHLVNVTLLGLNCYAYDNLVLGDEEIDDEEISVLTSALVLHDVNKYIHEKYDWDRDQNTEEIFEKYLEDDDFGVSTLFDQMDKDIEDYKEDILFLIQRTEINDRSQDTRGLSTEFRHLIDYCRLGDSVASRITNNRLEYGTEKLKSHYSGLNFENVHVLKFDSIQQPILNRGLISTVKEIVEDGEENLVLGSSNDSVLYLGKGIDRSELEDKVNEKFPEKISSEYEFKPKVGWNSTDYGVLEEVGIPVNKKKSILAEEFAEQLLEDGSAGVEGFENIPEDFQNLLPSLIKKIYIEADGEFELSESQERFDEIKEEEGGQKVKLHFIADLLDRWPESREEAEKIHENYQAGLEEDLTPEVNGFETVVERFFGNRESEVPEKEDQCFVCGRKAEKKYQKGQNAFYSTQSFSRRVAPSGTWSSYKKICPVCNLEYALLAYECNQRGVSPGSDVEVAYLYFDDFIGDVKLFEDKVSEALEDDDAELDSPDAMRDLWAPQFHIQPFYVGDKNHRMRRVREVMKKLDEFGMKAVLGKAFTRFETYNNIFYDEKPIRVQKNLGFDVIDDYKDLDRPLQFFSVIGSIAAEKNMSNPYIQLENDGFVEMADFMVVNNEKMIRNEDLREYFESYRGKEFMEMQKVAENGVDLFGKQFNSKHKKTKIFRETIDALLAGKSQGLDDQNLRTHVYGQVKTSAEREDYAGKVTGEQVENFVDSVIEYLQENDLYQLKKLSDWENALTNSYYYAYENILYGDQE